ncbi:MAG: quinone-dependent dihydroorotate dehydrogenase [Pseudomonadales bacterium]
MYSLARTALFALDPEASHHLSMTGLAGFGRCPGPIRPIAGTPREVMGLQFSNPIGLAAGLDKDAVAVLGLARLGFGFVEVGTVTPRPQAGNPRPRLFRAPAQKALINRMGFNNQGLDAMLQRLRRLRQDGRLQQTRLGVNIGKNKDTDNARAGDDYRHCFAAVSAYADYVTVNLSSPNTPGLRALQSAAALKTLLGPLKEQQQALHQRDGKYTPLTVKVAPDLDEDEVEAIAEQLLAFEIDGLIATNTTVTRPGISAALAAEAGGLSGAPLQPMALVAVSRFSDSLRGRIPIIGVGGIDSVTAGRAMLEAGAELLQIYSGFIYEGPALVRRLSQL